MDNNKKLAEELLRADGIDPANITETEHAAFKELLDTERKRMKRLSWLSIGTLWLFVIALIGLCVSESLLEKLHIPFAIPVIALSTTIVIVMMRWGPSHNSKLEESNKKISKLHYLVYGRHRGFAMVSKKDGKRIIHWPSLLTLTVVLFLGMSLAGAGVYYLMCQRWIYASPSGAMWVHIALCIYIPLGFLTGILRSGFKAPLEELVELKEKEKPSKPIFRPDVWNKIIKSNITKIAAVIIIIAALTTIYQLTGSIDGASVALADVAKQIEQMQNCVFEKTTTVFSKEENVTPLRAHKSEAYYTNGAYREDEFHDEMVIKQIYVNFSERTLIAIGHEMMVYKELKLTEEDVVELAPIGPNNLVSQILSKGDYKVLGRKTVDGILSEGFEFDDKRTLLSMDKEKTQQITVRLWVDVNTNLPVCVEADSVYNNLQVSVVQHNPTWNIELDADFFEPKIPADYITLEQRGLIGVDLDNWPTLKVIAGMAAEKAGIKDGDIVMKIDGNSIEHITSPDEAQKCLFGKAGEKVTLTVKRGEHFLTLEVIREPLPK